MPEKKTKKSNGNSGEAKTSAQPKWSVKGAVPKGKLLVIGGKEDKGNHGDHPDNKEIKVRPEVLQTFIDLMPQKKKVIEVITSASREDVEDTFETYRKIFSQCGVTDIHHIHHSNRSEILQDDLIERLDRATGIFMAGGDQLLLTSIYGGTPFLTKLKQKYINENFVVAGTSAGAMAMSTPMIYAGSKQVEQLSGEVKVTTGLEFLKDVCIDTHFVNRGRFVRMAQVIATNPGCLGFGVEEDTAMIITNGVEAEVIGSGVVIIMEGFEISNTNLSNSNLKATISIRDIKVHILGKGDKYIIKQTNPPHY
jgi:cyanophycinase